MNNSAYAHILFKKIGNDDQWACLTKKDHALLGVVEWYPRWRQFIFEPAPNTVHSHDCLLDIADFLSIQNQDERKIKREVMPNATK